MSRRLPAVKPRELLKALGRAGFTIHHVSGSHYVLKHPQKPRLRVIVPYHNKDLKRRTLSSIIYQAGLSAEQFLELL